MRPRRSRTAATLVAAAGLLLTGCASDPALLGEDLDQERFGGPRSEPSSGSTTRPSTDPQSRLPRVPSPTAAPALTPEPTPEPEPKA